MPTKTYQEIEDDFVSKKVHPLDLKMGLAKEIDILLKPVRSSVEGKDKLIEEAYS